MGNTHPPLVTLPSNILIYLIPLHDFASSFAKHNEISQKELTSFFELKSPHLSLFDFIEYCPPSYKESDSDIDYIFSFLSNIEEIKAHQPSAFESSNTLLKALINNPYLFSGLNIELPRSSLSKISDIACRLAYFYNTRYDIRPKRADVIPNFHHKENEPEFISLLTSINMKRSCGSMDNLLRNLMDVFFDKGLADIREYIKSEKEKAYNNANKQRKNEFIYNIKVDTQQ